MFAALCSAVAAAVIAVTQPSASAPVWKVSAAAIGGATGGFAFAMGVTYAIVWLRAPYRQRDRARGELGKARRTIKRLRDKRPVFSLGEPYSLAKEWLQATEMAGKDGIYDTVEAQMFRIPIRNAGYFCKDVTVRVVRVEPPFPDAPGISPVLHLHPPLSPHARYFPLARNDDAYVDYIGHASFAGGSWWLASASARDGFIYYEEDLKPEPVRRVTIEVLGGGRSVRRDYALFVNMAEDLDVTTWEEYEESTAAWERELAESGLTADEYVAKLFREREEADDKAADSGSEGVDEVPFV